MKNILVGAAVVSAMSGWCGVSDLQVEYRNGQVFLRWQEKDLPADARLSVWSGAEPITAGTLDRAVKVASLLNPGGARDWWLDVDSFVVRRSDKARAEEIFAGKVADTDAEKPRSVRGFVITDDGQPVDPAGGLHVHTPGPGKTGKRYFAVTWHHGTGTEVMGLTAAGPAAVGPGKVNAIRIAGKLDRARTEGRPLVVYLHGRGGGVGVDSRGNAVGTHMIFADSTLAWREGIPFKFTVEVRSDGAVWAVLCDRTWLGRKLTPRESDDDRDYVPAVASFWLGYNRNIAVSNLGPEFTWDNYSERVVLRIVRWIQEALGTDPARTYLYGGSMGGSGAVQLALHYPEVFAAAWALVPVYSYTWERMPKFPGLAPSISRMQCSIGLFKPTDRVLMPDGRDLLDYGSGAKNIDRPQVDMPPIFATNGRRDMSIPWVNNPPFFKAANRARQAFAVNWNNGAHGMSREVPPVVSMEKLFRYRLDQAFPAFSNSSDDRNYGDGDPDAGDLTGWINRGMEWSGVKDEPDRFEITLKAAHEDMKYPVVCDVTIRRRQKFKFAPGTEVEVSVNGRKRRTAIDADGLLVVTKVEFPDSGPVKLVCVPPPGGTAGSVLGSERR
ncbi:MAG: alpha/beta hydrolase [Lentisphaeria bacterium]|nr:alpha/beta hydrolase [Lentisphaeria bacterium]